MDSYLFQHGKHPKSPTSQHTVIRLCLVSSTAITRCVLSSPYTSSHTNHLDSNSLQHILTRSTLRWSTTFRGTFLSYSSTLTLSAMRFNLINNFGRQISLRRLNSRTLSPTTRQASTAFQFLLSFLSRHKQHWFLQF